MATFTETLSFTTTTCPACGISFGIPSHFEHERRQDHKSFYCPNGHTEYFSGDTDAQKLARAQAQIEEQKKSTAYWQVRAREEEGRAVLAKKATDRLKRRVANGVCPCCKRSFGNMRAHMKTKHPEYVEGAK